MQKKTVFLPPVRVTEDQGKKLERILDKSDMTYSEWIRDRIRRAREK